MATKKITGVKTPAQQKAALAKAKGPKAGSARSNQSVKLSKQDVAAIKDEGLARRAAAVRTNPDAIVESKNTEDGRYVAVSNGKTTATYLRSAETAELRKLAAVGSSFKAVVAYLKEHKPAAKLANGLDGRSAPQSAMAAAQSGKGGSSAASARGAGSSAGKGATTGQKNSASAKLSSKGDFDYKVGKPNDTREGTWTHYMVNIVQSKTNSGHAKAAHAKSGQYSNKKLDFTWLKAKGYIK